MLQVKCYICHCNIHDKGKNPGPNLLGVLWCLAKQSSCKQCHLFYIFDLLIFRKKHNEVGKNNVFEKTIFCVGLLTSCSKSNKMPLANRFSLRHLILSSESLASKSRSIFTDASWRSSDEPMPYRDEAFVTVEWFLRAEVSLSLYFAQTILELSIVSSFLRHSFFKRICRATHLVQYLWGLMIKDNTFLEMTLIWQCNIVVTM